LAAAAFAAGAARRGFLQHSSAKQSPLASAITPPATPAAMGKATGLVPSDGGAGALLVLLELPAPLPSMLRLGLGLLWVATG
jgi:hypothetical protein